jgi:D-lyxose ketol-isomerase
MKEELKEVYKVWGKELWVVNCKEYCGKLLYLDKGAESSLHRHLRKKETFYALWGLVGLELEGKGYMLSPLARPKTILPKQWHRFHGLTKAIVLEISSHHEDSDVERMEASKEGYEKWNGQENTSIIHLIA